MLGLADSIDWCDTCEFHGYDSNAIKETVKYMTLNANATETQTINTYDCVTVESGENCCPVDGGGEVCSPNECTSCTFDHDQVINGSATSNTHVDKFGNFYVDTCVSSSSGYTGDDDGGFALGVFNLLSNANGDADVIWTKYFQVLRTYRSCPGCTGIPDVLSGGGNVWHVEFHTTISSYDRCGNLVSTTDVPMVIIDFDGGLGTIRIKTFAVNPNLPRSHCVSDGSNPVWVQTSDETTTYNGLAFDYTLDIEGADSISFDQPVHREIHGRLSNPYTSQNQRDDALFNLSQYPLGDETIYPWLTPGVDAITKGPYVHYDEGSDRPEAGRCIENIIYTGNVIGKPGPVGIDFVFNKDHPNYCVCTTDNSSTFYIIDYGARSTDIGIPSATNWTDNRVASNSPQGSYAKMNMDWTTPATGHGDPIRIFDDTLWLCKAAYIIFPKQSYSYDRPCGADRFQLSASTDRCIDSIDGLTINISPFGNPIQNIPANGPIYVGGTDTLDGIWNASVSDYSVVLTDPRIVSASSLPQPIVNNNGSGIIAGLRWPNPLQPAICGRYTIVSANNKNPVTCSLSDQTYLVNNDNITIVNALGNIINGVHDVDVIDNQTIALRGVNGISQSVYTGSGQIYSTNAVDYKWQDNSRKNDAVSLLFQYDFRTIGEYYRLVNQTASLLGNYDCSPADDPHFCTLPVSGATIPKPQPFQAQCQMDETITHNSCSTICLPPSACSPSVVYYAPTDENFGVASKNMGFFIPECDQQYGMLYVQIPKQSMDDPLAPYVPCPCELNEDTGIIECDSSMREDDGSCQADDDETNPKIKYYAKRNQYEARCEVPPGAPALPPGVYIGCLKTSDFTSPTCPQGVVCNGPFFEPNNVFTKGDRCNAVSTFPYEIPWIYLLSEEGCVCAEGRFSLDYFGNGISCGDFLPPA
jgi:hypothetical protein